MIETQSTYYFSRIYKRLRHSNLSEGCWYFESIFHWKDKGQPYLDFRRPNAGGGVLEAEEKLGFSYAQQSLFPPVWLVQLWSPHLKEYETDYKFIQRGIWKMILDFKEFLNPD
jgi:hypothetical protein